MTKDIKDYLQFYLGSQFRYRYIDYEPGQWVVWSELNTGRLHKLLHDHSIESIQLALRPLSDMTEEEARVILPDMQTEDKLIEWGYYNEYSDGNVFYQYLKKAEDERLSSIIEDSLGVPEHWIFLLSKGFDLFGLIESGLAIDKTKLQS